MTALSRSEPVEAGSNQQMHGKTAPLKSSVPCTEEPEKVQEPPDNRPLTEHGGTFAQARPSSQGKRDLLLHGRLYISPNWLCFHASLFGKDIKPSSKKSLSVRKFPQEAKCESLEALVPEMKWRKVCPASTSLSLPDNIPCVSRIPTDSTDGCFSSRKPPGSETVCEEDTLEEEPTVDQELRLWDSRLLKVIFVMICFLVASSSYLAFRISRLEQQLCSLNWAGPLPGN
ncbi:hypothetical protein STEG23_036356, partial [Scotinomys teguina]